MPRDRSRAGDGPPSGLGGWRKARLIEEILALSSRAAPADLPASEAAADRLTTVRVPAEVEPLFLRKMGVIDPIERLSAGPIHFAFSG